MQQAADLCGQDTVKLLVGLKSDLQANQLESDQLNEIGRENGFAIKQCSAKTGEGIKDIYFYVLRQIVEKNVAKLREVMGKKRRRCDCM